MNDLTKKRIAAFIIDYVILCALASVVDTVGMIAAADKMDAGTIQILHMVYACHIYMQYSFDGDLLLYLGCIRKTGSRKKADEDRVIA